MLLFIGSAPLIMIGYIMFLATGVEDHMTRYGATFIIASGSFSFGALCNAQASANVVSDSARAAAIGTNVMFGNIGGLISTVCKVINSNAHGIHGHLLTILFPLQWSFLPTDAPDYHIGNGLNLATSSMILIVSILLLLWMQRDNKKRAGKDVDAELQGLSLSQVQDLDWKHPAFRWRP